MAPPADHAEATADESDSSLDGDTRDTMPPSTEQAAVVDLGSNSFHLLCGSFAGSLLLVRDRIKEPVQMARGLAEDGSLDPEAHARAMVALDRFRERLVAYPPDRVVARATNTVRQLKKQRAFLKEASERLGHEIEVISGDEEARLIYQGVIHSVAIDAWPLLVLDIGGGSTELALGDSKRAQSLDSLHIGCVSFTRRFFEDGRITQARYERALRTALVELLSSVPNYAGKPRTVIGCSGTFRALARLTSEGDMVGDTLRKGPLKELRERFLDCGSIDKLPEKGMSERRRSVIIGGLAIAEALFKALEVDSIRVVDASLREGLLFENWGDDEGGVNVRAETIRSLVSRFMIDRTQGERVRRLSLALFDQVCDDWDLTDFAREMLTSAALVHEIGLAVRHSGSHKHAHYLVSNLHLPGFGNRGQAWLAALVGNHRRKIRKRFMEPAPEADQKMLLRTTVLLRLARKIMRSRQEAEAKAQLKVSKSRVELTVPREWGDRRPLLGDDLELEQDYFERAGLELRVRRGD